MPDADNEKVKLEASGIGNVQANNNSKAWSFVNIIGEFPLEKILFAQLVAAIIIQVMGYLCSLVTYLASSDTGYYIVYILGFGFCFPIIFGLPAIYGLVMGFSLKNRKIIIMSLTSGALSLLVICPLFSFGALFNLAE